MPDHTDTQPPKTHTPNRLIREKSPYLLQHAYNPVDWYPWGEEAFAKAKAEDKPIFLSVGYSTCYWCHVMEEESFENPEIAKQINASFVPIKVDREERPDIDAIYMAAVQAIAGQGGWPMTVFLSPDGKPFWGGTYFPPEDRYGRPGLKRVLQSLAQAWQTKREDITRSGESVAAAIQAGMPPMGSHALTLAVLEQGAEQFAEQYDPIEHGFGPAPKFPRSHALSFLMRMWSRRHDARTLEMVEATLDAMARGGIHDQLGGGFHRYSTDARWLAPHFEKMLYDQALLARSYLEAFQATHAPRHAEVARDIFAYVLRDLRDPGGAFYGAEDAGAVGHEGEFYVWTADEIRAALGDEDARIVERAYNVRPEGNFTPEAHSSGRPENILHLRKPVDAIAKDLAKDLGLPPEEIITRLTAARTKLLAARDRRPRPHLDDKILTDWNGLMIGALAYGGRALDDEAYTRAATEAADFILRRMQRDGVLLHRYRDGEASIPGFLDDYAAFAWGLLELYDTTLDPRWLKESQRLARQMITLFWDDAQGGFFLSGSRNEPLIARTKELYDGAVPSGNSMAALVLVRLGHLTMDRELEARAQRFFDAFSGQLTQMPHAFPQSLIALDLQLGPVQEIALAGDPSTVEMQRLLRVIRERFLPRTLLALRPSESGAAEPGAAADAEALVSWLKAREPLRGKATAYVCTDYVCQLPVTDPEQLRARLDQPSGSAPRSPNPPQ